MKTFRSDIKEKNFKRFYLFYGDEDYLKNQYSKDLLDAIMPEKDDMNYSRFVEKEVVVEQIIDLAETMPFFADRRVIFINNSNFFNTANEKFNEYMENSPEFTTFIFVEEKVDGKTKAFKQVSKLGAVCKCTMPSQDQIAAWINKKTKAANKTIKGDALNEFLQRTNESMDNMQSEFDKLIDYVGDKEEIELEDVCSICTKQLSSKVFDMINAIAKKDTNQVIEYYHDLLASKEPAQKILALIERQFRNLLNVKSLKMEGMSFVDIANKLNSRDFFVKRDLNMSKNFSLEQIESLLEEAAELEANFKTGKIDDTLAIELLMIKYSN